MIYGKFKCGRLSYERLCSHHAALKPQEHEAYHYYKYIDEYAQMKVFKKEVTIEGKKIIKPEEKEASILNLVELTERRRYTARYYKSEINKGHAKWELKLEIETKYHQKYKVLDNYIVSCQNGEEELYNVKQRGTTRNLGNRYSVFKTLKNLLPVRYTVKKIWNLNISPKFKSKRLNNMCNRITEVMKESHARK